MVGDFSRLIALQYAPAMGYTRLQVSQYLAVTHELIEHHQIDMLQTFALADMPGFIPPLKQWSAIQSGHLVQQTGFSLT